MLGAHWLHTPLATPQFNVGAWPREVWACEKNRCLLQTLLSALPSNIELRGGKGTANQRAPNIAKHCFFRKHRYRHKIKSRAAPFRSIPFPCSSFRIPCVQYMQYTRMTSALHALYSRRRHCPCKWTKKGTRTDKWKKKKQKADTKSAHSQHTVNIQSTHSQHTVNTQSTSGIKSRFARYSRRKQQKVKREGVSSNSI